MASVYVATGIAADMYLLSLADYDRVYGGPRAKKTDAWSRSPISVARYEMDTEVRHIRIGFRQINWWSLSSFAARFWRLLLLD